jgi:D-hexose-6-phosphate mutarotase
MATSSIPDQLRKHEIPGRVRVATGTGGLPKIGITTKISTAEIYLLGAHVTGFQKNGEPPLLFMSAKSWFAPGKPIRGGVPVCFPWFGGREGDAAHGFARVTDWELVKTSAAADGSVALQFRLPEIPERPAWKNLRAELVVTVSDRLTMELTAVNNSAAAMAIENCLHTYFHVGDIGVVSLAGLQGAPFDDFTAGAGGARKVENDSVLEITKETNRVYPNHAGTVEIRDANLKRTIRVEKFNSQSTVVWNPWTTQKLPDDFDPAEHRHMVCVESGNVKQNKILLAPEKTSALKVVLSSAPLK